MDSDNGVARLRRIAWLVLFHSACLGSQASCASESTDFEASFRGGKFDNTFLVPTSQGNANLTRLEKDGVHLTSSRGQLVNNLGFGPRFKLRGDFEVTATFTVLRSPQPADGFGTGAIVQLNTSGLSTAIFGRLCRKDGKEVISTYAAMGGGEQRQTTARMFPTKATTQSFRVARAGNTLTFSCAEPPSDTFKTLSSVQFDTEDVILLRCGLQQSHADADVEVVWHDLRIHATELVDLPNTLKAGEKQHRPQLQYTAPAPFPWAWASSTIVLAVLFVAYWWRQHRLNC